MLITIPQITKGAPATLALSKQDLFGLPPVSADDYFSVPQNVYACTVEYTAEGNQHKAATFYLSETTPTATILFSLRSRSSFELHRIILRDFDGGVLIVRRADLPSGLDITITA